MEKKTKSLIIGIVIILIAIVILIWIMRKEKPSSNGNGGGNGGGNGADLINRNTTDYIELFPPSVQLMNVSYYHHIENMEISSQVIKQNIRSMLNAFRVHGYINDTQYANGIIQAENLGY